MKILLLPIGFILGGMTGIVCMCLVQINRVSEEELRKVELNNEKELEKEKNSNEKTE